MGGAGIDTVGMCFDTTASNTGRFSGACVLLESLFQRPLLWMACRHHMFEVLLAEVFKECIGLPLVQIFYYLNTSDRLGQNYTISPKMQGLS